MEFLIVGFGGCLGAIARYVIYLAEKSLLQHKFPLATLIINCVGCLLAGAVLAMGERFAPTERHLLLFCTMGFISSFTTFSTFSVETLALISSNQMGSALANVILNVVLGVLSIWGGQQIISNLKY
ncbi:MAG: fluoride efflux transporter CrcB [Oligoflexia bacterium]|nr:fluoride efflux transporter CrcB [Oligoflexia bacterium]MBF0366273.1 fluoride efflux transporter CrcB [Oligoflexia bacterium]